MATETGDDPFKNTKTVSPRTRKAVHDYLQVATRLPPVGTIDDLSRLVERFADIGEEVIPAFIETLEADRVEERLASSLMLLYLHTQYPGEVPRGALSRVETIVLELVGGDNVDLRLGACLGMLNVNLTNGLSQRLSCLRADSDPYVAVLAASALARHKTEDVPIQTLTTALAGKDKVLAAFAAVAMLKIPLLPDLAIKKIRNHLPVLKHPLLQLQILIAARALGQVAAELSNSITTIAENESAEMGLRQMAVSALGAIGGHLSGVRKKLLDIMLKSPHVALILGAIDGLNMSGNLPIEAAAILSSRLSSPRTAIRHAAAYGLSVMGSLATPVKSIIIQRLGEESDIDTCWRLAETLAKMGREVVDDLLEVVREGNVYRVRYAGSALVTIGDGAARRIAELLPSISDERVYETLIEVLGGMGKNAAPAMPVLANILNETTDENLALLIVRTICHCGRSAAEAVPALINCVAERGISQSDIGTWAERALWVLREHSVPAMKAALLQATGLAKEHLEEALRSVTSSSEQVTAVTGGDEKTSALLKTIDVELLRRFFAIGEILENGAMSWRNLSAIIVNNKDHRLKPRGLTSRNLAKNIADLGTLLDVTLTTHGDQKKGTLTPQGEQWLAEVREYLRQKDARRKPPES
jgi:HEAT repeat protein